MVEQKGFKRRESKTEPVQRSGETNFICGSNAVLDGPNRWVTAPYPFCPGIKLLRAMDHRDMKVNEFVIVTGLYPNRRGIRPFVFGEKMGNIQSKTIRSVLLLHMFCFGYFVN